MAERSALRARIGLAVLVTALCALLFRFLVASPYRVETSAMEPATRPGDVVMGLRGAGAERGDAIVFDVPKAWLQGRSGGSTAVSRVVGQPGDEVRCCDKEGRLVVNGLSVALAPEPTPTPFRVVVGPGVLFVRGDNPAGSVDSRCFLHSLGEGALVPMASVRSRLATTVWPLWRMGGLDGKPHLTTVPPGSDATPVIEAATDVAC